MDNWIELTKERYLSVDKMNDIYKNFLFINKKLVEMGYTPSETIDNRVKYNISPANILDKMNAVEKNIQAIDAATDWINPYYKSFEWTHRTENKKAEVDRWIMYLNYTYKVLTNTIKALKWLVDQDGNYITDKNGNYILVYKEETNG